MLKRERKSRDDAGKCFLKRQALPMRLPWNQKQSFFNFMEAVREFKEAEAGQELIHAENSFGLQLLGQAREAAAARIDLQPRVEHEQCILKSLLFL